MENKVVYGSRAITREESLYLITEELKQSILNDENLCDKAFRIVERAEGGKKPPFYKEETVFEIQEIPVKSVEFITVHQPATYVGVIHKYTWKERLKIFLFGGTITEKR